MAKAAASAAAYAFWNAAFCLAIHARCASSSDMTSGVTVALPVTLSAPGASPRLEHRAWTGRLIAGRFGVREPGPDALLIPPEAVDLALVPALAVAMDGTRLGYGGGFYDRTLEKLRAQGPVLAIGHAYAAQASSNLPLEPTDQPLDLIVTDSGIVEPRR